MKTVTKAIFALFMLMTILSSCTGISATPLTVTEAPVVRATISATLIFSTETVVPPTEKSSVVVSGTPTTIGLENGLTWTECILPYKEYFHNKEDIKIITTCLGMELPYWDDSDRTKHGDRIRGINGDNLRLILAGDIFETRYTQSNPYDYELLKNGSVIATAIAHFVTFDPNRSLGKLGGKLVWEVISEPPVIIVDGVNFNEKYQLEGSFFPYEIKGKLIYLAMKNGKYHVMYDEQVTGSEFDEISMAYCCATLSVTYGKGQYWFLGRRDGVQYIVAIH